MTDVPLPPVGTRVRASFDARAVGAKDPHPATVWGTLLSDEGDTIVVGTPSRSTRFHRARLLSMEVDR